MSRNHFIFDFETLGQNTQTCPVIDCSFIVVQEDSMGNNEYTFDALVNSCSKIKLDVSEQVKKYGYKVEKSTVKWWESQGEEARKNIAPKASDVSLREFCEEVLSYLNGFSKIDYWWARSNTFDPIILERLFRDCGLIDEFNQVLKFWAVRDTRSFINGALGFDFSDKFIPDEKLKEKFVAHDSRHDVAMDILRMQAIISD